MPNGNNMVWIQAALAVLSLLLTGIIIPVVRIFSRQRMAEIAHLQACADKIELAVLRVEEKINGHIEWHLSDSAKRWRGGP